MYPPSSWIQWSSPVVATLPCLCALPTTFIQNKFEWRGCGTGKKWPQVSVPLTWCLMGIGTTRFIPTWSMYRLHQKKLPAWSNTPASVYQCFMSGVSVPLWCKLCIKCKMHKWTFLNLFLTVLDPSLPVPEQIKIAVGLCGLMLGFVIVSSGFFYYKRKSAAYIAFCQGDVIVLKLSNCKCNKLRYNVIHFPQIFVLHLVLI